MLNVYPIAEVDSPYEDCLQKRAQRYINCALALLSINLRHMISYITEGTWSKAWRLRKSDSAHFYRSWCLCLSPTHLL